MLKTFINAWKIADLRKKIIYTVFILFLFRLGCAIPVPFIDITQDGGLVGDSTGTFLNYLSMMTGDAFNYGRVFALGITPYINSSIILQLLAVAIPALEKLSHDEEGRKKMAAITRYLTIGLAVMQSIAYYVYLYSSGNMLTPVESKGWAVLQAVFIVSILTAGSALVMWLGEQINEKGIGNGISLILFAGIVSRVPSILYTLAAKPYYQGSWYYLVSPLAIISLLAMIVYICWMDAAERRIPVQYAKRVVGRKMYGGQSSNIPIKVNMSGVMPIIFANSIVAIPATIGMIFGVKQGTFWGKVVNFFSSGSWFYVIIFVILIIAFSYFYVSISFNPVEVSNNMKKQGGFVPGIRPGKPTSDYIKKILGRVTLIGAFFLCVVAALPLIASIVSGGKLSGIAFGGSSLLIVVGVALETARELEAQLTMRHYKGFLE